MRSVWQACDHSSLLPCQRQPAQGLGDKEVSKGTQHRAKLAQEVQGELIPSLLPLPRLGEAVTPQKLRCPVPRCPEAWLCRGCQGCGPGRGNPAFAGLPKEHPPTPHPAGPDPPQDFPQGPQLGPQDGEAAISLTPVLCQKK